MGNLCSISISCDGIISHCQDCSARKATYISELEDNVVALETALQELIEARNDVMTRVIVAEQQQMKRLDQVQGWLSRVQDMETRVGELMKDRSHEINKLCFGGFCSKNLRSSYKFGKKVFKLKNAVTTLMADGAFQVLAERVPEATVDEIPSQPALVGLQATTDKVWRCLYEEEVRIIGLYGMGGVGKTTLLTQINNKFLDTPKDFDVVIWVVVSKDVQLEKIQERIGERLRLSDKSWKKKSLEEKARDIFKILSKKKFVLLLDDIWERVDLTKIGVPFASLRIASKIVFTTRSIDVCGLMESNRTFKVECLTDEEAWELFQNKVGEETLNSHPDILELAKCVAQECGGLPLALITTGRAMAYKKTPQEWNYAIQVLRRSASEFPGMGKEVYPLLKFSYDSLPDDKTRSCLLYCSLFSEDHNICKSRLIDFWIGEGFFDENDPDETQNKGYYIIGVLLHACLLEESGPDFVKMHDVVRDMALWITCEIEKQNVLVKAGAGLTEAPAIVQWEGPTRISLMDNQIGDLSESSTCSRLTTLFLHSNNLETIDSHFFQLMPSLKVLNLSSNNLKELPPGISRLFSLQYLDLSYTLITELPNELKALVNLKCLNLEGIGSLRTIPRQLISSFSMLQVLRMFITDSMAFSAQEQDNVLFGGHEFLVEELLGLRYINVLTITLTSSSAFTRFLSSSKLRSCTQSLCLQSFSDSKPLDVLSLADLKHLHTLHISSLYLKELMIGGAQEVLSIQETQRFRSLHTVDVDCCFPSMDLTWLIFAQNLKFLYVGKCNNIEEIICARKIGQLPEMMRTLQPFGKLEFLQLEDLLQLESIFCNVLPFPHLKNILVQECPNLKKLPLDSNSAKECKIVILGEESWWKMLQWEDQATQMLFFPVSNLGPYNLSS